MADGVKIGSGYIEVSVQGIKEAEKDIYQFADVYEVVEQKAEALNATVPKLERAFDWTTIVSPKIRRLTEDFDFATLRLDGGLARTTTATKSTAQGMGALQQQIMAGSYAFQDFTATSGDLGAKLNSITNNLPTLLMGLGSLGTVISVAGTAAVALYRNWDTVTGLFQNTTAIPKAVGDLDGLRGKLKEVKDELERLNGIGFLTDTQFARYGDLERQRHDLEESVKARSQIEQLKNTATDAQKQVVKAFHEAITEAGPKKTLEQLEKDIQSSEVPAVKKQFESIFNRINKGERDAYDALIEYARANPEKYGDLAKQLEVELVKAMNQGQQGRPMDDAVKKFKEDRKKDLELGKQLTKQGVLEQQDMIEKMAKEAEDGMLAIFADPLKAMIVKGRAAGVAAEKEVSHLKNQAEAEARRLFPELEKAFPRAFEGVVNGIVAKLREAVDKTIEQLRAREGLTKQEAIRRLNMDRAAKGQANAENLAADEFAQFAGANFRRNAAFNPGGPALTPEMQREMGRQIQEQMKEMGVGPREQAQIGKLLNATVGNARRERVLDEAMQALMNRGLDQAGAMRELPAVVGQLRAGAGGVEQAIDRIVNARMREQRAAINRRGQEQGGGGFRSIPPGAGGGRDAMAATGQAVGNTGKLIGITAQLDGEVARLRQVAEAQSRAIDMLGRNVQARQRRGGGR
jgi:hypothetical protein